MLRSRKPEGVLLCSRITGRGFRKTRACRGQELPCRLWFVGFNVPRRETALLGRPHLSLVR